MVDYKQIFYIGNLISGVGLIGLSWYLASKRALRLNLAIAGFLMLLGAQVIVTNAAPLVVDGDTRILLRNLGFLMALLQPVVLLYLVWKLPNGGKDKRIASWAMLATLIFAIAGGLLTFVRPSAFLANSELQRWGAVAPLFFNVPYFIGFGIAFVLASRVLSRQPTTPQSRLLFMGLWMPVAFQAISTLARTWATRASTETVEFYGGVSNLTLYLATALISTTCMVWAAAHFLRNARHAPSTLAAVAIVGWALLPIFFTPEMLDNDWGLVLFTPGIVRLAALVPLFGYGRLFAEGVRLPKSQRTVEQATRLISMLMIAALILLSVASILLTIDVLNRPPETTPPTPESTTPLQGSASMLMVASTLMGFMWLVAASNGAPVRDLVELVRSVGRNKRALAAPP